jgi:DNA-binding PadR family transcriptional regulator
MKKEAELYAYLYEHADTEHFSLDLEEALGMRLGSIYPLLVRLEHRKGHLESRWEDLPPGETRRPRRLYRLSGPGYLKARQLAEGL